MVSLTGEEGFGISQASLIAMAGLLANWIAKKKKRMEDFTLSLKRRNSHSCHSSQNQRASPGDILSSTYTYLRVWGWAEFSGILEGSNGKPTARLVGLRVLAVPNLSAASLAALL